MNGIRWSEILKELNELSDLHERGASDPAKCREFNSRASIFLDRLEEMGANEIADRVMGILGGLQPKGFLSMRETPVHKRITGEIARACKE